MGDPSLGTISERQREGGKFVMYVPLMFMYPVRVGLILYQSVVNDFSLLDGVNSFVDITMSLMPLLRSLD